MQKHRSRRARIAIAGTMVALAAAGSAEAFQALPPGGQVNDDPAAGINKALGVSSDSPNADVVGGALTAGKPAVPWSIFRHRESEGSHDQIFSRSFANGAWTTRGNGTVGGSSSASPRFSGSLNFDQKQDGEAPAIDFAGTGRTVPWATWYENTTGALFGDNNIFASRFDNTGDANQGKWIFGGQGRGTGGDPASSVPVPSLNIHTSEKAENPSVAGGSAADATKPGPWVAWQETDNLPVKGQTQIFVSRPIGPGQTDCDGVTPAGVKVAGHVPAIGGFCFQQTGIGRVGTGQADPSLSVDPTRNAVEPDIAFTGKNAANVQDGVPWVVWYEEDDTTTGISGLTHKNDMVFAAKGINDGNSAHGNFAWTAVGNAGSGLLDASGNNHFGACAASDTAEAACSLNKNPNAGAENPRVAAGTMNPANPTVPWVAWDEDLNGVKQVFVSRLVGTGSAAHFELVNNGAPLSIGANDSIRPDITFSGNTPYVSWREDTGGGVEKAFVGHFVNASNPTFVLDQSDVPLAQADLREPISSGCTANPFNNDGQACQGAAVGTPFFLFTNGTSPLGLFADAYQPDAPATGAASGVSTSAATLSGSVNPNGASVKVSFEYGTTTAYGQSTAVQTLAPSNAATPFTAALSGLPAGTTIHYRAVAASDFGTFVGADQTLTTAQLPPPPPGPGTATVGHPKVSGKTASVRISCTGKAGAQCKLTLTMTVTETLKGHKVIAVSASKSRKHKKVVTVGRKSLTLSAGNSETVKISLNGKGQKLLKARHTLKAKLRVSEALGGGKTETVATKTVTFKARGHRHGGH